MYTEAVDTVLTKKLALLQSIFQRCHKAVLYCFRVLCLMFWCLIFAASATVCRLVCQQVWGSSRGAWREEGVMRGAAVRCSRSRAGLGVLCPACCVLYCCIALRSVALPAARRVNNSSNQSIDH